MCIQSTLLCGGVGGCGNAQQPFCGWRVQWREEETWEEEKLQTIFRGAINSCTVVNCRGILHHTRQYMRILLYTLCLLQKAIQNYKLYHKNLALQRYRCPFFRINTVPARCFGSLSSSCNCHYKCNNVVVQNILQEHNTYNGVRGERWPETDPTAFYQISRSLEKKMCFVVAKAILLRSCVCSSAYPPALLLIWIQGKQNIMLCIKVMSIRFNSANILHLLIWKCSPMTISAAWKNATQQPLPAIWCAYKKMWQIMAVEVLMAWIFFTIDRWKLTGRGAELLL